MVVKDQGILSNFEKAIEYEWLETNGLGGWAGSTIIGCNTRRYHGLLVAATSPPTERMVLLSKLNEAILFGDNRFELGTNQYNGNVVQPSGFLQLSRFEKGLFPQWIYEIEGIQLRKTIAMVHGENTVIITYQLLQAPDTISLEFLPLIAGRDYHTLNHKASELNLEAAFGSGTLHSVPDGKTDLFIQIPGSFYHHDPHWFYKFQYSVERHRGLDDTEDLFNPGLFMVSLNPGDILGIIISTENPEMKNIDDLLEKEEHRRKTLLRDQPPNELVQQLVLAADQFIVERNIPLEYRLYVF